jgi:hypothetical protein
VKMRDQRIMIPMTVYRRYLGCEGREVNRFLKRVAPIEVSDEEATAVESESESDSVDPVGDLGKFNGSGGISDRYCPERRYDGKLKLEVIVRPLSRSIKSLAWRSVPYVFDIVYGSGRSPVLSANRLDWLVPGSTLAEFVLALSYSEEELVYRSAVMAQSVLLPRPPSGDMAVLAKEPHEVERAIASLSIGCILIHSHNLRSSSDGEGEKTPIIMNSKYPDVERRRSMPIGPSFRWRNRRVSYRALEGVRIVCMISLIYQVIEEVGSLHDRNLYIYG